MDGLKHRDSLEAGLRWEPVYRSLESRTRSGDTLLLLISPFIGVEALRNVLQSPGVRDDVKVVVRWRPADLVAGVSDLEIYPLLAQRNIPLYINHDIHLKLYVFASNAAFNTSGNLTLRGLGYSEKSNIEVGSFISLVQEDWLHLYSLISSSKQVDEAMYQRLRHYLDNCARDSEPPPPPTDLYGVPKTFTIATLPAIETPTNLAEFYFHVDPFKYSPEDIRRGAHDLATFGVPHGLSREEFDGRLDHSFRNTPFVVEFVKVLVAEKSLRFGAVNEWIHRMCEDVPLPYRWEIKENTRIFYNWLEHFFPDISWDRPNHSQVIYWRKPEQSGRAESHHG